MRLRKYHGLGNDYLVVRPEELTSTLDVETIQRVCHRNLGVGSDGILVGPYFPGSPDFEQISTAAGLSDEVASAGLAALRIFNPDGSEAEKSGNGLRIFSRFLFDEGIVKDAPFRLNTLGGQVCARILDPAEKIQVEMGRVSFVSEEIPVTGKRREVLREKISLKGREWTYCAASIGNPHCIVLCEDISKDLAVEFGSLLEANERFPNKINVQFLTVIDSHCIAIEIWERGAGYTLASGSSACACAATAVKLGLCQSPVTVQMPGGTLYAEISSDFYLTQIGPVKRIFEGDWLPED